MVRTDGWVGRILWVDLSSGRMEERDTLTYGRDYLGGRGIAAKIAWDEIPPGVRAFDAENNLLIFMTGPLTGTTAPFSGRVAVCGVSPQTFPHEWFTRSNMGGRFGAQLKYAGYDGLVLTGRAEGPVYLWVHDGKAELREAEGLWGKGTYATQEALRAEHGRGIACATIGQAGERLSRIAIVNSDTESAAGQGGFGAVMGSKRLKAIAVQGTGAVRVARPEEFFARCRTIVREVKHPFGSPTLAEAQDPRPDHIAKYGERRYGCSQQCTVHCSRHYRRVPRVVTEGPKMSGQMHCVSPLFQGFPQSFYDWKVGFEAGFELTTLTNDYGLNHWDIILGIAPWLRACQEAGLLTQLDGDAIDLDSPVFWVNVVQRMARREGTGDMLAEGGRRLPALFGLGEDEIHDLYPGWGFAGHWDGHGDHANYIIYPFWLVSFLQWAVDSRDAFSSGHGYAEGLMVWTPLLAGERGLTWEQIKAVGPKVYGAEHATDVRSDYEDKAVPAFFHTRRSALKDSLSLCDWIFPRIFSNATEDCVARADGMYGPSYEYLLYTAATGEELEEEEMHLASERILNVERAILIRNNGRSRADDLTVIPHFETPENEVNPFLGEPQRGERKKLLKLLEEYYGLAGWDARTGRPMPARLDELRLGTLARELEERGLITGE